MVCRPMISTLAGISWAVSPSREALGATTLELSGVGVFGCARDPATGFVVVVARVRLRVRACTRVRRSGGRAFDRLSVW